MVRLFRVTPWLIAIALVVAGCETPTLDTITAPPLGGNNKPAASAGQVQKPAPSSPVTAAPPARPQPGAPQRVASLPAGATSPTSPTPSPTSPAATQPQPGTPVTAPAGPSLQAPIVSDEPIRIALLLPLTGSDANIGRDLLDAAQLALFDAAPKGFELTPRDTKGTPEGAHEAAESAIQNGAQIILGPLFGTSVRAAALAARTRGVPIVAFSTDRAVAGDGVYLLGIMPDQQIGRVVAFAARQGLGRYAALVPANPYGSAVIDALNRATNRYGGVVVQVEQYAPSASEFREPVLRLADFTRRRASLEAQRQRLASRDDTLSKQALRRLEQLETLGGLPFDAVVLPEGGPTLRRLAPLLAFYDIDPDKIRFIGTALWQEATVGREPSLVGGWFAAPPPAQSAAFLARFAQIYGRRPARIATLAYDAVALAVALTQGSGGPDFSRAAITSLSGFAGVDGVFRFRPDGIPERGLAVVEVEADGFRVISPAPQTFERVTN